MANLLPLREIASDADRAEMWNLFSHTQQNKTKRYPKIWIWS